MSQNEKEIVQRITEAASALPDKKREYILGYAEGVIAMASSNQACADEDRSSV